MGLVVIYRSFQLGQRLLDHAAGAGCVQTQESAAAETELTALAEGHAGLLHAELFQRRVVQAQSSGVDPAEIGGLRGIGLQLGEMLGAEFANEAHVAAQIDQQLIQPLLTLLIGGHGSHQREAVVPGNVHPLQLRHVGVLVFHGVIDDGGGLEARQIEGLAGGDAGGGDGGDLRGHGGHGDVLVTIQHQVGVDLIGDDPHTVLYADIAHRLQLLTGPDPAHRVVGVAEDEILHAVGGLLRKVLQIHSVTAIFIPLQGADHQLTASVVYHVGKGVVHRLLNEDLIGGLGEHGQHHPHTGNHAGGEGHVLRVRQPAVALLLPCGDGLEILGRPPGVAEDALIGAGLDGVHDAGGGLEIHVRDPQGDHIIGAVVQDGLLHLGGVVL